jgi:orsellinic acid C2-O-methyltransferase
MRGVRVCQTSFERVCGTPSGRGPVIALRVERLNSVFVQQPDMTAPVSNCGDTEVALNLPDLLAREPQTAAQLAAATGCHEASLQRVLRALATVPLWEERDDGAFALAPMGALLRGDAANSLRAWAVWWGQHLWVEWGHLLHTVQTGESARRLLSRTTGMERLEHDVALAAKFNAAMADLTRIIADDVARVSDFSNLRRIVDIGGGNGQLLSMVLRAYPDSHGVLYDRPHAIAAAQANLQRQRLLDRCEMISGDFFDAVPAGGDVYILKSIIHDWNDERSLAILKNCRAAMPGHARLLLIEQVVPERMRPDARHQDIARRDINMLIGAGGRERTLGEYRRLLEQSGFAMQREIPVALGHSVLEAICR